MPESEVDSLTRKRTQRGLVSGFSIGGIIMINDNRPCFERGAAPATGGADMA
jgi:hypothetical protein